MMRINLTNVNESLVCLVLLEVSTLQAYAQFLYKGSNFVFFEVASLVRGLSHFHSPSDAVLRRLENRP